MCLLHSTHVRGHWTAPCDGKGQCHCISFYSVVEINVLSYALNVTHISLLTYIILYINCI